MNPPLRTCRQKVCLFTPFLMGICFKDNMKLYLSDEHLSCRQLLKIVEIVKTVRCRLIYENCET